ncbi:MAG TPA: hypothetical protein VKF59_20650 [Candidatus Dormibacteraeota bacterium]|nr:hypothetical protein [Candidatus Dormibacteraeota bacterium]
MAAGLLLLLVQAAAGWFAAGFIWTMQVLHYPLFARVGEADFPAYEREHNRRFFPLIVPSVLVVIVTAVALLFSRPGQVPVVAPILVLALAAVIVVSTARFQAPAHARLASGFDAAVHRGLVMGNWVRTIAWTAIGLLDLVALWLALRP